MSNSTFPFIATAKVIKTFLIIETLDTLGFYLLPSAIPFHFFLLN
jgi:hypothetical protein